MEHEKGRQMVREFADAIRSWERQEGAAQENLVKVVRALAAFYPNHIWKEDYLLLPLAERILTPADQRELAENFERVDQEIGEEIQARLKRLAEELDAQVSSGGSA